MAIDKVNSTSTKDRDEMNRIRREAFDGPSATPEFVTKDSGERQQFASGMQRDTSTDKMRPDLAMDGPMFMRWVGLMTRGAVKYTARNWMKASDQAELDRFRESLFRHFVQYWFGLMPEEDHAAAIFFNINGIEYLKNKMERAEKTPVLNYDAATWEAGLKAARNTRPDVDFEFDSDNAKREWEAGFQDALANKSMRIKEQRSAAYERGCRAAREQAL